MVAGQSFCRDHIPTEILDTSTIDPAYVSEKYIEATSWRTVQEKTDTEDVISHRVTKTLYESAIHSRGSMKTLVLRQFLFFFLVQMTCFCTLAWGAQPLASICLCMLYGVLIVARSETMLRFGLGFATNTYIMVWYIATSLSNAAENGQVPVSKLLSLAVEILVTSAAWGLTAGFSVGLIPGMASGLCVIQLSSSTEHSRSTLDTIFPGTVKALLMQEFSSSAIFYWLTLNVLSFGIFSLVNKRHTRYVLAILFIPCLVISYGYSHLGIIEMDVWILFPVFVLGSWPVCLHTISWARSLGSEQKAAGLRKNDLINTTVQSFFPGFLLGATCGVYLLGGKIKMKTLNDFFECVAIPVLIFFLSRSCAIHQYFSPSIYKNKLPAKTHKNQLHQCFKLLVRDFAGQMVYHCIHQPFLPKYGIFICVFSWRKAREHSLRFAMGEQTAGNDECLEEILFWLKNISMHRLHPNAQAGDSANTDNLLDCNDIKSVFLVATHADVESCGLSDEQKLKIMNYYKQAIKKHTDVYTSIQFKVSEGGEISVENSRDGVQDEGIETLKRCVLDTAQEVITHCFPNPVPVYFWCWLKQKRDRCMETGSPPCELLAESDIDMDARYMSVYPQCTFNTMINMFCNIGEIFLVRNNDENGRAIDYYIFFNLQFLIDFMKDIITIDETKRADCLNAKEWQKLDRDGKASVNLLKIHLKRFYKNHKMTQKYSDKELVRQPLVNSMLQLDFMFIIGEEFYIPQLLPKLSNQHNQQDHFKEVSDMLWEYVFDFQEFDFHHEYVFFRLLAQCANDNHCQIRQVCCDWASIYRISDQILNRSTDAPQEQWFTLSCEQRGKDGGQHNRIYLRTSKDCNRQHSLDILQLIKGNMYA